MKNNFMENNDKPGFSDNTRYQLKKFGYNMVALALSIGLYYLGFFGTVEGPLNPSAIGQYLRSFGFSRYHLLFVLFVLFVISLTWNLIYNTSIKIILSLKYTKGEKIKKTTRETVKKGKWGHTLWASMLIIITAVTLHIFIS